MQSPIDCTGHSPMKWARSLVCFKCSYGIPQPQLSLSLESSYSTKHIVGNRMFIGWKNESELAVFQVSEKVTSVQDLTLNNLFIIIKNDGLSQYWVICTSHSSFMGTWGLTYGEGSFDSFNKYLLTIYSVSSCTRHWEYKNK